MNGRMKHSADGKLYRGRVIQFAPSIPQGRPGRYTVDGRPFAQLCQARDYIDGQAAGGGNVPGLF